MRLAIILDAEHPGHGDASYYYEVASNLVERGALEVDYIWHFLSPPEQVTHPAGDYWSVGASLLLALPMAMGGALKSALGMSICFGLLVGLGTFALAKCLCASRMAVFGACAVVLFQPHLLNYSTSTDAVIFYVAFASGSLACCAHAGESPRAYVRAACLAALAFYTRQDSVLLCPALACAVLASRHSWATKRRALLRGTCAYLVCLAPLFAYNWTQHGSILPQGPSRTFFARHYRDIYTYAEPLTWDSYRAWGWINIWQSKWDALLSNLTQLRRLLSDGLWLLIVFGLLRLIRRSPEYRPIALAGVLVLVLQLVFYSFIGTTVAAHGSYLRAVLCLVPFLVVCAFKALDRSVSAPLAAILILGLSLPTVRTCYAGAMRKVQINNNMARQGRVVSDALQHLTKPTKATPVVMSMNPWALHQSSGFGIVQFPSGDLGAALEVADRYNVTHLVLPKTNMTVTPAIAAATPGLKLVLELEHPPVRIFEFVDRAREPATNRTRGNWTQRH